MKSQQLQAQVVELNGRPVTIPPVSCRADPLAIARAAAGEHCSEDGDVATVCVTFPDGRREQYRVTLHVKVRTTAERCEEVPA